jgi:hypothetical protein
VSWEYGRLVAEVYELDKPVGSSFPGLEYYTRQLAGVTGRILEPATGTGRVLVPLLEAGFTVEGLDSSPDMLAVCREHCRDRGLDPVLREADMTVFAEPAAYQAIIWSLPEFGHLLTGAGFTGISVTANYHDGRQPGPDSRVWTFHAVRPR